MNSLKKDEFVFCEDVQKWYRYQSGNLKLPKRFRLRERPYYEENKELQKMRKK